MIGDPGTCLVAGATSALARRMAERLGAAGWRVILAGRDADELERTAQDLRLRHNHAAEWVEWSADRSFDQDAFWERLAAEHEDLRGLVLASGFMGELEEDEAEPARLAAITDANYEGPAKLALAACATMAPIPHCWIVGISSVAGERGRASNYLYASAKAGFTQFLSGLRARMAPHGIHVLTVKPGFLDTAMTFGKTPPKLTASPDKGAELILSALKRRKAVAYVPGFWRAIMTIICLLPEPIFMKMKN
jgi:decaprenylphospho-beta-D-erythro-pentofuranosid-2-ulose 2-reductase